MKILKISLSVLFLMAFVMVGLQAQTTVDLKATKCSKTSAKKDANCTPGCCALCPPACCKGTAKSKATAVANQSESSEKGKTCCSLLPSACCKSVDSKAKSTNKVMAENVSLKSAKNPCCKTKAGCTKTAAKSKVAF